MEQSIIFSGFGGQGALFAGQVLAYAAMAAGLEVTWIPSYGPEMRGGTAHCTVVVADESIGSPLVRQPSMVVALNLPSTDKYETLVAPGGIFVVDSAVVRRAIARSDIRVIAIPASQIAANHGDVRLANMAMLGALIAVSELMPVAAIEQGLRRHLSGQREQLLAANLAALHDGMAAARGQPAGQPGAKSS